MVLRMAFCQNPCSGRRYEPTSRMGINTRNLAVLFADVAGSTTLYEKLGDRAALHAIDRVLVVDAHRVVFDGVPREAVDFYTDLVRSKYEAAKGDRA